MKSQNSCDFSPICFGNNNGYLLLFWLREAFTNTRENTWIRWKRLLFCKFIMEGGKGGNLGGNQFNHRNQRENIKILNVIFFLKLIVPCQLYYTIFNFGLVWCGPRYPQIWTMRKSQHFKPSTSILSSQDLHIKHLFSTKKMYSRISWQTKLMLTMTW